MTKSKKILSAADRLLEAKQLLLEAGVAPNGRFVRELDELHKNLDLFARLIPGGAS